MKPSLARLAVVAAIFALVQIGVFHAGVYNRILDPGSSAAAFDDAVDSLRRWHADRRRDVLVFGDSRIYAGLNPAIAAKSNRPLRFLNAGIPGTSPRVWYFLDRAVDPSADRFRAVVIPVDSLADDTSAIGSLDANEHATDLGYVLFHVRPDDVAGLAASVERPADTHDLELDLLLRGPFLRPDFQSLLDDPLARLAALRSARHDAYEPEAAHPFSPSLSGLAVDFRSGAITYPRSVAADERRNIADQVLRAPVPSPRYAAYRRRWLAPIVRHYVAAHVPVIFVRIPTRPVHRETDDELGGVVRSLLVPGKVMLLAPGPYRALERPELFADHDHLDARGSAVFSARLGRDVATTLSTVPVRSTAAALPAFEIAPIRPESAVARLKALLGFAQPIRFQSVTYAIFLSVVLATVASVGSSYVVVVLLASSVYFYARWNAWFVVMLAFIAVTDFFAARRIASERPHRRFFLIAGIAMNLSLLGGLKYTNFAASTLSGMLGRSDPWVFSILVPVGISFHTFQSVSYLVDVYRDRTLVERRFERYALYIAFFPQLLAGPIVRARTFFTELTDWRRPGARDLEAGALRIATGLAKKACIADRFAACSDAYFASPRTHPGFYPAWAAAVSFAIQIYFDFAGYTDIAIGSARVLGFAFPSNFRRPYLAASIRDFWRRWNITLSTWLRDYLYIPLGGSRSGGLATYKNLMVTMLLGGLWHGANWTFVAWGGYQGALLSAEHRLGTTDRARLDGVRVVRTLATFVLVVLGWVLFRSSSFADACSTWSQMLRVGGPFPVPTLWPMLVVAFVMTLEALAEFCPRTEARWARSGAWTCCVFFGTLVALELLSWTGPEQPFVYFKF